MRKVLNPILTLALVACIIWAAVAPGMQALIPTFLGIAAGICLLSRKTDYIKYY